ncbi:hypothetical protein BTO06_10310 [Tenacibaculum sp. SZ-18]|uniref:DUF6090 family protein n=1 Tax=Tenacibaculum sp. SZ-18 TaxID=754423 RepID=UPI000C2D512F|nr:DUF6090 family protein [Tenacibaculum sp. SZ-18]AUC15509.1 hypothetical protein BTO06_10310 [Tenacibaculum sp. SZ-18]
MIKPFRNIRQNLLSEGKTIKYLKYAVGEIILVVIGILIALQVNNWNQNEQLKKDELRILKSMQKSIKINIDEFDQTLNNQIQRNGSLQEVKNMYILLLNKMGNVIAKGKSLKSEYHSLVTDLENEIENNEGTTPSKLL